MSPPPRLHVLMTADAVGGVWIHASTLARELCRRGHKVSLVTLGPEPRRDQLAALDNIKGLSLETTDLALEWVDPEGLDHQRALDAIAAIERRVQPDIVHLNGYRDAVGPWRTPTLVVAHSCVWSWWLACRGTAPEPRWRNYLINVAAGLSAADRWAAPSAAFRDTIEQLYRPNKPGLAIWNGIDESLSPSAKEPFILAAGRLWDEAKCVSLLASIAPRVPWPIEAAGPLQEFDSERHTYLGHIKELGELPRPALLALMRRAAILAAPAVYEPFGLTVLEAAKAGCALVLSDIPSFRELWHGAAVLVDPRDEAAWQAVLTHLTHNSALREDLQRRARERANRYSLRAMSDAYVELYQDMAGGARTPRRAARASVAEARP